MSALFDEVNCWACSLKEYQKMFDLKAEDLQVKIVDCAAGFASFNAELSAQGGQVVSVDPLYSFSSAALEQRIPSMLSKMQEALDAEKANSAGKNSYYTSHFMADHSAAAQIFMDDFVKGFEQERYVNATLPLLPFADQQFDLAVCAYFLFLRPERFDLEFHLKALEEMCRVATEVRIFPLNKGAVKQLVGPLMLHFQQLDYGLEIREASYELGQEGNAMLRLWRTRCDLK